MYTLCNDDEDDEEGRQMIKAFADQVFEGGDVDVDVEVDVVVGSILDQNIIIFPNIFQKGSLVRL